MKRIDPSTSLKISLKNVEHKTLSSSEVIDPSLSSAQVAELQSKISTNDRIASSLKKVLEQINQNYLSGEDEEAQDFSPPPTSTMPIKTRSDFFKSKQYKPKT